MTDRTGDLTPGDPLRREDERRTAPLWGAEAPTEDLAARPAGHRADVGSPPAGGLEAPGGYAPGSPVPPGAGGAAPWGPPPGTGGAPAAWQPTGPPAGRRRLAGWWRRVGANLIDLIIIGVLALVLLIPIGAGFGSVDSDAGAAALVGALIVTALGFGLAALVYAPLLLWKTNGKTVGRMATGIRVVRADGRPMTFGVAVLREVVLKALVFGVLGSATFSLAYLLDVLWPLWDEEKRALHDFPVNTRTVLD